ncbi:MAG: hypothetical protein AMJ92_08570 [candidate division Zixibacteria bacterium SM23_81]|nr:MAG: hypothetical protein AMJ92_08570 [candidate division Zixibacteria bacterium SM23_81]
MRAPSTRGWLVPFICLLLIVAFVVAPATAGKKHEVAGKMTMAQTIREAIDVGDAKEHVLSLAKWEGTNESAGENKFMDGAQVVNMSFGDLVQGNGPHQGYVKLMLGEDAVFCNWEGMVASTVPEEGAPIMAFEGTYSYIKGTGQFENIKGGGTYKGQFTSKTELTTEWKGKYSIEK